MRRPSRTRLCAVLALCACTPSLSAQDLESLAKTNPLSFSGGLSFNQVFHTSAGIAARRDPYTYVAAANLNLSVYGWTIPLRFTFSNHQTTFSQPFNQYALHPRWKWITAHAGYASVSYSPYTVSGHLFLGGAVDLEPAGKWKFNALYGRFLKATPYDTSHSMTHAPAYQRMGYGSRFSYEDAGDHVTLILFAAHDRSDARLLIPDSAGVLPQQNLVASVSGAKTLPGGFVIRSEFASSALTRDRRAETTDHAHPLAKIAGFDARTSTAYYHALKSSLDYRKDNWMLGVGYERIDPEYRTLGAYYFNNDLENITANSSLTLLQGKFSAAASAGVQRDNLAGDKISTMRRVVGSINASFTPSSQTNFSCAYSTFQTFTHIRSQFDIVNQVTPYENLDTLNFSQVSRNASVTGMLTLQASETRRQSLQFQGSWQEAQERQGDFQNAGGTHFFNFLTGYNLSLIPRNLTAALSFNATFNEGPFTHTRIAGPTVALAQAFFQRKLRSAFSAAYNETYSRGIKANTVTTGRWNAVVSVRNSHSFNLNVAVVSRKTFGDGNARATLELTATAGYSYSFNSGSTTRAGHAKQNLNTNRDALR